MNNSIAIIGKGNLAEIISHELSGSEIINLNEFKESGFEKHKNIVFIGALGICVRAVLPFVQSKYTDAAVVCVDSCGKYAISVLSGHIGGANDLTKRVAMAIGALPIITTQSDNSGMWALDMIGVEFGWETFTNCKSLNEAIIAYVNGGEVALLLDVRDRGTQWMEQNLTDGMQVFYNLSDLLRKHNDGAGFKLIIAVTPFLYNVDVPMVTYIPKVIHIGVGCKKGCDSQQLCSGIMHKLAECGVSLASVASLNTIDIKENEPAIVELAKRLGVKLNVYSKEELSSVDVPNPSRKALETVGVASVAEAASLKASGLGKLVIEKQKGGNDTRCSYTFSATLDNYALRGGFIEIIGAGPGDPELISVRGKRMLEVADLILYAGSLVPIELTYYAKAGAVVRSSASMDLQEQFTLMKSFYDRGLFIVRLHTGDPSIYGAIQEQMAFFDKFNMRYHITPGISSFLAAAAELKSQFTIPDKVQTIILTRGEGRTPMPEKEKLHLLAKSQSTMCIFLSASVVDDVQKDLLEHYPSTTPVAVCYHLTWKDQKIFRGELCNLAKIVKDNSLTLTTMIVVGEALDCREGFSKLYDRDFKHLFRK